MPTVAKERLPNEYQLHTRARKQVEAKVIGSNDAQTKLKSVETTPTHF